MLKVMSWKKDWSHFSAPFLAESCFVYLVENKFISCHMTKFMFLRCNGTTNGTHWPPKYDCSWITYRNFKSMSWWSQGQCRGYEVTWPLIYKHLFNIMKFFHIMNEEFIAISHFIAVPVVFKFSLLTQLQCEFSISKWFAVICNFITFYWNPGCASGRSTIKKRGTVPAKYGKHDYQRHSKCKGTGIPENALESIDTQKVIKQIKQT